MASLAGEYLRLGGILEKYWLENKICCVYEFRLIKPRTCLVPGLFCSLGAELVGEELIDDSARKLRLWDGWCMRVSVYMYVCVCCYCEDIGRMYSSNRCIRHAYILWIPTTCAGCIVRAIAHVVYCLFFWPPS